MNRWYALVALSALAACRAPKPAAAPRAPNITSPPHVAPGELDPNAVLSDLPARAARLGAGPASIVASGELVEGERIGAFVDVPSDVCLLAYARGSNSVEDVDIAAFAEEGDPVAADEGPDPRPTMLLCPPHPRRVFLAAHVATGEGLVALAAQLVAKDKAAELGRALGAHGSISQEPRPAEAWPGLDDHVRARRQALGGTWEELRRVAVSVDSRVPTSLGFSLEADQCLDVLVVPDDDVSLLDVELVDSDGRALAHAKDTESDSAVTLCSPLAFTGAIGIRPHIGRGLVAVVLAHARGDVAKDLSASPEIAWIATAPLEKATRARSALLAKLGYPAATETKGQLVMGRRVSLPLHTKAGSCVRIDVVAGAPLALVRASAWDDAGDLVSSAEGADAATLFACAKSGAPGASRAHVDVEARGRPGPFAVLTRAEHWQDALFAKHALAAARMLVRAAEGPTAILLGQPTAVHEAIVDASHAFSWETSIPPGNCWRVAAGGDGQGTGLELRIFDAASGAEVDRSHASHAVSARACAPPDGSLNARAELRATAGKMDAIIGERM